MGVIVPDPEFLEGIREVTQRHGALLVFDEVISGFRVGPGGAQERFGIMPDLTCLGKIIGGGLPVGAYGGRKSIMEKMAPEGDIYQAGTLSGNPLAMAAGIATLKILKRDNPYVLLEEKARHLFNGLEKAARSSGIRVTVNRVGSMGTLFFREGPVSDFSSAKASDGDLFKRYYRLMLNEGIYLAPSAFEATFVSTAHDNESIEKSIESAGKSFEAI
jgi:glutamate-1-semialdehyde 2,1-aminomutase